MLLDLSGAICTLALRVGKIVIIRSRSLVLFALTTSRCKLSCIMSTFSRIHWLLQIGQLSLRRIQTRLYRSCTCATRPDVFYRLISGSTSRHSIRFGIKRAKVATCTTTISIATWAICARICSTLSIRVSINRNVSCLCRSKVFITGS